VIAGLGAAVIAVCYGFARYAYGLFVPRFAADFGLGGSGLGVLGGLCTAGYVAGLLLAPRVARRSARSAVIGSGAVASLGLALMGLAGSVPVFAVGLVVAGGSAGLVSPAVAEVIVRGVADAPARGRAQTWANTGTSFGLAAAAFTPVLAIGWHTIWLGFAAVAAVVTVVALRLPAAPAADVGADEPASAARGNDGTTRWPAGLTALLLNAAMIGLTSAPFWTFFVSRVREAGVSAGGATWCWFAIGAVGPLGGLAGSLSQRYGLKQVNIGTWTLWAGGLGVLALPGLGLVGSLAAAGVLGATYMALTGLCILWGSRLFPTRPARGVTLAFLSLGVGQTVGSAISGTLVDLLGLASVFALVAVTSLAAWSQILGPFTPVEEAPKLSKVRGRMSSETELIERHGHEEVLHMSRMVGPDDLQRPALQC
jgi:MFS family permease